MAIKKRNFGEAVEDILDNTRSDRPGMLDGVAAETAVGSKMSTFDGSRGKKGKNGTRSYKENATLTVEQRKAMHNTNLCFTDDEYFKMRMVLTKKKSSVQALFHDACVKIIEREYQKLIGD